MNSQSIVDKKTFDHTKQDFFRLEFPIKTTTTSHWIYFIFLLLSKLRLTTFIKANDDDLRWMFLIHSPNHIT